LTEVQDRLHYVQIELAEDWMVVMKAEMAHIYLYLLLSGFTFAEFLPDLEESFFDLSLNTRL